MFFYTYLYLLHLEHSLFARAAPAAALGDCGPLGLFLLPAGLPLGILRGLKLST